MIGSSRGNSNIRKSSSNPFDILRTREARQVTDVQQVRPKRPSKAQKLSKPVTHQQPVESDRTPNPSDSVTTFEAAVLPVTQPVSPGPSSPVKKQPTTPVTAPKPSPSAATPVETSTMNALESNAEIEPPHPPTPLPTFRARRFTGDLATNKNHANTHYEQMYIATPERHKVHALFSQTETPISKGAMRVNYGLLKRRPNAAYPFYVPTTPKEKQSMLKRVFRAVSGMFSEPTGDDVRFTSIQSIPYHLSNGATTLPSNLPTTSSYISSYDEDGDKLDESEISEQVMSVNNDIATQKQSLSWYTAAQSNPLDMLPQITPENVSDPSFLVSMFKMMVTMQSEVIELRTQVEELQEKCKNGSFGSGAKPAGAPASSESAHPLRPPGRPAFLEGLPSRANLFGGGVPTLNKVGNAAPGAGLLPGGKKPAGAATGGAAGLDLSQIGKIKLRSVSLTPKPKTPQKKEEPNSILAGFKLRPVQQSSAVPSAQGNATQPAEVKPATFHPLGNASLHGARKTPTINNGVKTFLSPRSRLRQTNPLQFAPEQHHVTVAKSSLRSIPRSPGGTPLKNPQQLNGKLSTPTTRNNTLANRSQSNNENGVVNPLSVLRQRFGCPDPVPTTTNAQSTPANPFASLLRSTGRAQQLYGGSVAKPQAPLTHTPSHNASDASLTQLTPFNQRLLLARQQSHEQEQLQEALQFDNEQRVSSSPHPQPSHDNHFGIDGVYPISLSSPLKLTAPSPPPKKARKQRIGIVLLPRPVFGRTTPMPRAPQFSPGLQAKINAHHFELLMQEKTREHEQFLAEQAHHEQKMQHEKERQAKMAEQRRQEKEQKRLLEEEKKKNQPPVLTWASIVSGNIDPAAIKGLSQQTSSHANPPMANCKPVDITVKPQTIDRTTSIPDFSPVITKEEEAKRIEHTNSILQHHEEWDPIYHMQQIQSKASAATLTPFKFVDPKARKQKAKERQRRIEMQKRMAVSIKSILKKNPTVTPNVQQSALAYVLSSSPNGTHHPHADVTEAQQQSEQQQQHLTVEDITRRNQLMNAQIHQEELAREEEAQKLKEERRAQRRAKREARNKKQDADCVPAPQGSEPVKSAAVSPPQQQKPRRRPTPKQTQPADHMVKSSTESKQKSKSPVPKHEPMTVQQNSPKHPSPKTSSPQEHRPHHSAPVPPTPVPPTPVLHRQAPQQTPQVTPLQKAAKAACNIRAAAVMPQHSSYAMRGSENEEPHMSQAFMSPFTSPHLNRFATKATNSLSKDHSHPSLPHDPKQQQERAMTPAVRKAFGKINHQQQRNLAHLQG